MKQRHNCAKMLLALLGVMLTVLALILVTKIDPADARYLPTRADETDVEVLKDLIRELLAQSNMDQIESRLGQRLATAATGNDRYYHQPDGGHRRFQVERRASELPLGVNGDSSIRRMD